MCAGNDYFCISSTGRCGSKTEICKNYTVLYENSTGKGVYTYTVTNLTKGQRVKWSLSGTGKVMQS